MKIELAEAKEKERKYAKKLLRKITSRTSALQVELTKMRQLKANA